MTLEAGRKGETFDVFREVPSDHLVQQLGGGLNNRRADDTVAGVGSDPGLTKMMSGEI